MGYKIKIMGLFDLFKPAWQSKNELRAIESLADITDPSKLAEIAQNAPLVRVRQVAAERKKALEEFDEAKTYICPLCGTVTQGIQHTCINCNWNNSICPYVSGFNTQTQLYEKCGFKPGNNDCAANPYGYLYENCPIYIAHPYDGQAKTSILDKYRMGLSFLNGCGEFDEAKFREFNHIIGNRFSDTDIENQLRNAKLMIRGMEELKQVLRSTMVEAINTFEELE